LTSLVFVSAHDRVLLENVKALTLRSGEWTSGRRSSGVPQLKCVGGTARDHSEYQPSVVQCTNVGSDGSGDIQWKCESQLDSSVRLGTTTVTCEGYSHPDDPYILKGSCGLEYTLDLTSQYHSAHKGYESGYNSYPSSTYGKSQTSSGWGASGLVKTVMIGVAVYIIWSIYKQMSINSANAQNAAGGNGGGPGGYGGGYGGGAGGGYGGGNAYQAPPPSGYSAPSSTGGGTGFWTGLGLGSLMGGAFSRPWFGGGYSRPWGSGWGSGWGSRGWGSGYGQGYNGYGQGYQQHSAPSSFGGRSSFGSSTHTSTGFGGTRRR